MHRKTGRWLVLGALMTIAAIDVGAQEPRAAPRGARGVVDVEAIMQMRGRLELSEDQIARLDALRHDAVERRSAQMAELAELRSQLRAGQIRRSEVMAYMEERREENQGLAEARRTEIESILTSDQLSTVDELRIRTRAFRRGRMSARRGAPGDVRFRRPGGGPTRGFSPDRGRPGAGPDGAPFPRRMPGLEAPLDSGPASAEGRTEPAD